MASNSKRQHRASSQGANIGPLQDLIESQQIYAKYKDTAGADEAAKKLSSAVGSQTPLPLLRQNLDKAMEPGSPLSDLTLTLTLAESKKRR